MATPTRAAATDGAQPVFYRAVKVDGLSISYREAGRPDAPTLLLLHCFPSSSRMYEPLLSRLSGQFHLVAPDYPSFGHSDAHDARAFSYTFDHLAEVMQHFTEALSLERCSLYLQDYGGPVGFRLMLAHPERLQALIIQSAVTHEDGLGPLWQERREDQCMQPEAAPSLVHLKRLRAFLGWRWRTPTEFAPRRFRSASRRLDVHPL